MYQVEWPEAHPPIGARALKRSGFDSLTDISYLRAGNFALGPFGSTFWADCSKHYHPRVHVQVLRKITQQR